MINAEPANLAPQPHNFVNQSDSVSRQLRHSELAFLELLLVRVALDQLFYEEVFWHVVTVHFPVSVLHLDLGVEVDFQMVKVCLFCDEVLTADRRSFLGHLFLTFF